MVLREKDDADYYFNVYRENPTLENLENLIRYRPQDRFDAISKKISLDMIRFENEKREGISKDGKQDKENSMG